jgi:hypothetical protein
MPVAVIARILSKAVELVPIENDGPTVMELAAVNSAIIITGIKRLPLFSVVSISVEAALLASTETDMTCI